MKLKRVAIITNEEGAEYAALMKEKDELSYLVAKFNLKERNFIQTLFRKYELKQGAVYTIKKRGIYTNG